MKAAQRAQMLLEVADNLADRRWDEIVMILTAFKIPTENGGVNYSNSRTYLRAVLPQAEDQMLLELHNYVCGQEEVSPAPAAPDGKWQPGFLRAFLSHDTRDKQELSNVKAALKRYGIDGFVAHEDIEPTTEWMEEIRLRLATCDAVVAYLTPRFHESRWTDQEIGFCMGRGVPVIAVRLGVDPYGVMMPFQGIQGLGQPASDIAIDIFEALLLQSQTQVKLADFLLTRFEKVTTWEGARDWMTRLQKLKVWTPEMLRRLTAAAEENVKIKESWGVPDKIKELVVKHGTR